MEIQRKGSRSEFTVNQFEEINIIYEAVCFCYSILNALPLPSPILLLPFSNLIKVKPFFFLFQTPKFYQF